MHLHSASAVNASPTDAIDAQAAIDRILAAYPDVLSDTLPDHPLHGQPMDIVLREDTKIVPRCATTTKPVPTHMAEDADKYIQDLIRDNIVEQVPEGEVSQWISPALSLIHI